MDVQYSNAPDGDEFQPTAMFSARTLCSSSLACSSLLPIHPRTTVSIALVPAAPGFTAAPCSPHVGLTVSDCVIMRAAASSAFARSFIEAEGTRVAMRCVSVMFAFSQSAATSLQMDRKSAARVADVLSMAHRMSNRRFWIFDSPVPSVRLWPRTKAESSRPSDEAPSMWTAKLPAVPPASMMASPTWSCDNGPISERIFSHVFAEGIQGTIFFSYCRTPSLSLTKILRSLLGITMPK